ncbi:solute carrier family 2, facilitated glucose transporter member 1-like isoform X2 [Sipha flava]|uniref:Solute carrier family 2, facilitated glucose transporter member 1-like isoform X2 n=1 Tax=Sipha flava TaxID=143950 RepID=A0A8B8FIZ6_9HEMI|nr:solute carrier family 2, facilitated glucose transporter member 1-like isoform X2 [Sipha flava]
MSHCSFYHACHGIKLPEASDLDDEMEFKNTENEIKTPDSNYLLDKSECQIKESKVSRILIFTTITISLGCSIPTGYNTGVVNAPALVMKQWCNETIVNRYGVHFTPTQLDGLWSILVSIFLLGGIAGGIAGGKLADILGRKGTLKLIYLIYLVSGVLFISCKTLAMVELFFIARLLSGLSAGLTMTTVPMYLLELSPSDKKGIFGVMFTVGLNFGLLFSQLLGLESILGSESLWPFLFSFYASLVLLVFPTLSFIPESPKYLYTIRNERSKALSELSRLRGKPISDVSWELEDLFASPEVWTLKRILLEPASFKALIITCTLMLGQQLSGINVVFYYSTEILIKSGLSVYWAQYANLGAGSVGFIVTVMSALFIDRFGRKSLLLFSVTVSVVMLSAILTSIVVLTHNSITWVSYLLIIFIFGYVLFYGFGLGPIPFFIGSELTDVGPRPIIMSAMAVSNWTGNFLVGLTFPFINNMIKEYSFSPFVMFTILLIVFIWKVVPETKISSSGLRSNNV